MTRQTVAGMLRFREHHAVEMSWGSALLHGEGESLQADDPKPGQLASLDSFESSTSPCSISSKFDLDDVCSHSITARLRMEIAAAN